MKCAIAALLLLGSALAVADTLVLTDGRRLQGDLLRDGDYWILTEAGGKTSRIAVSEVRSIELGKRTTDVETAKQRLAFVRRQADSQTDPALAVAKFEEFVSQYGDSAQAGDARKDLAMWRTRVQERRVRVGGKWLTPDELAAWDEKTTASLEEARAHVKAQRFKEAIAVTDAVLVDDPANVGAMYLKGVALFRTEQLVAARKCFDAAAAAAPDNGPVQNNLAVVQWKQKQELAAINAFDRALMASPANQRVMDNVAEILVALPREVKNAVATRRLAKRFDEQEPKLEQAMTRRGMYRWGSTWVNQQQQEELRRVDQQIRGKLDELAADYDSTESSITQISQDIDAAQKTMERIESDSITRDANGNVVRRPYPSIYYDMRRDIDRLNARRKTAIERLDSLRQQADSVRAKLAVPPYTGVLRLIEEEGMPLTLRSAGAPAAASAPVVPSTQP